VKGFEYVFSIESLFSPLAPKGEFYPQGLCLKHPAGGDSPSGVRGEYGIEFFTLYHPELRELVINKLPKFCEGIFSS
jgi:hypothetical protein